jgi:hypothetical protein
VEDQPANHPNHPNLTNHSSDNPPHLPLAPRPLSTVIPFATIAKKNAPVKNLTGASHHPFSGANH